MYMHILVKINNNPPSKKSTHKRRKVQKSLGLYLDTIDD